MPTPTHRAAWRKHRSIGSFSTWLKSLFARAKTKGRCASLTEAKHDVVYFNGTLKKPLKPHGKTCFAGSRNTERLLPFQDALSRRKKSRRVRHTNNGLSLKIATAARDARPF
jgi:hypothetical protein